MFASARHCLWLTALTALLYARPAIARDDRPSAAGRTDAVRAPRPSGRGQHGGNQGLLRSFYRPPQYPAESNHIFDLWEPGSLATFAAVHGLTNNRALIIDSHGTDRFSWSGPQYVFRPNTKAVPPGTQVPTYSIRDVARVLGPEAAATIHNIVIAGCNEGGVLQTVHFRRHFVNATNITHMAAGNLAYKPTFFQALTCHSEEIEPLYGQPVTDANGRVKMEISRRRGEGTVLLGNYVAELFVPGAARPYRCQRAGRELLEPGFPRTAQNTAARLEPISLAEPAAITGSPDQPNPR